MDGRDEHGLDDGDRSRPKTRQAQVASRESRKLGPAGDFVIIAGERPHRPGQGRATLHAAMGDVFKIVRFDAAGEPRAGDGRDRHPVAAMRAWEQEARQARWGNVLEWHGVLPAWCFSGSETSRFHRNHFRTDLCRSQEKFVRRI